MLLFLLACAPLAAGPASRASVDTAVDTAHPDTAHPDLPAFTGIHLGVGCAPPPAPTHFVLTGGTVVGLGRADLEVRDGIIVTAGTFVIPDGVATIDVTGAWLAPAAIDSHVHLADLPEGDELARGGVAAAVDLAAPTSFLAEDHAPLRVVAAGPMITAESGYPTEGWGSDGYGLEVTTAAEATAAVDTLHALGARVVKLPLAGGPTLDDTAFSAAIDRAHALGEPVVSHALGDTEAARAAALGVDVLAHTPTEPLSAEGAAAWSGRAVISTLGAFGGRATTLANLAALRDAGATVLYGTDFGNTRTAGIDAREVALLVDAGLSPSEVLTAMTSAPAAFWGLDMLGSLTTGKAASLLVLPDDPLVDPTVMAEPTAVYLDGVRID
jgi:imidazolonepropionase-like amidohydrolase